MDNSKYTNSFFLFFLYTYELIKLSFCIETLKKTSNNMLFDTGKTVAVCTFFMVLFSAYIYFIDPYRKW